MPRSPRKPKIGIGVRSGDGFKLMPAPRLLSKWPSPRLPNWVNRVNEPLAEKELAAVRLSAQRGRPRMATRAGWNRSPDDSTLNQQCVHVDANGFDS